MARLIYSAICSLDGYVADADGSVRLGGARRGGARLRQRARAAGRHLSLRPADVRDDGRLGDARGGSGAVGDAVDFAAIWRAADKVVYSRTLARRVERPHAPRARVRPRSRRGHEGARRIATSRSAVPSSPAQALRAGLVDECHLLLTPVVVGGGTRALPDGVRLRLELLDERRFGSGVVYLRYRALP